MTLQTPRRTIRLIDDPQTVSSAYRRLAEYQAKAGLYAEAEKSLEKFVGNTEYVKEARKDTRQLIASYKTAGRKIRHGNGREPITSRFATSRTNLL